jgi:IS30 family transposase
MKPRTPLTQQEQERAKVLNASGKTPNAIAKSMGRSHHTLAKFLRKPETREQINVQRAELATMFDNVAHRIVDSVNDEDIKKANLVQKMTSAGISVDKASLLRGDTPTFNVNVAVLMEVVDAIKTQESAVSAHLCQRARERLTIPANDEN